MDVERRLVKSGLLNAVKENKPMWWINLNAVEWSKSGVLDEADLVEIETAIEVRNAIDAQYVITDEQSEGDNGDDC